MSNQIRKKAEEVKEIGTSIKHTLKGDTDIEILDIAKKVALASGAAIVVYWFISGLFSSKSKSSSGKKKQKDNSLLFGLVKQQLGVFLLAIFRKQITQWLKEHKLIDEENS